MRSTPGEPVPGQTQDGPGAEPVHARGEPVGPRGLGARHFLRALPYLVAALGLVALPLLPPAVPGSPGPLDGLRTVASSLRGEGAALVFADFAQDLVGARALLSGADPYPVLGPAFENLGYLWPVEHRSTHPPTAFLFAVPFAAAEWESAVRAWVALMLTMLAVTGWALRLSTPGTVALYLLLLWPPAAWSMVQLTPLWAAGMALAWRWRDRGALAGVALGVASLTKFLPALGLIPFLLRRQWSAVAGFGAVWIAALGVVMVMNPEALGRYAAVLPETAGQTVARSDNGALFAAAAQAGGVAGFLLACGMVLVVAWRAARLAFGERPHEWTSWALWVWLTVALLPIAWNYSLLPLAPWLLLVLRERRPLPSLLASVSLGFGFLDSLVEAPTVGLSIVAAGLAFFLVTDDQEQLRLRGASVRVPLLQGGPPGHPSR